MVVYRNSSDSFKNRKLIGCHFFNIGISENYHITVVADFFVKSRILLSPLLQANFNIEHCLGKRLVRVIGKVLCIVKNGNRNARLGSKIFPCNLLVIGVFDKFTDSALACRTAINRVFSAVNGNITALTLFQTVNFFSRKVGFDIIALCALSAAHSLAES